MEATGAGDLTDPAAAQAAQGVQDLWRDISVVGTSVSYVDAVLGVDGGNGAPVLPDAANDIQARLDAAALSRTGPLIGTLINEDRTRANVQLSMRDGDNQAMDELADLTEEYLRLNPLPAGVSVEWGGETYLNLVWQDKMVSGMLKAFASTFGVVLVLMVLLFRSVRWAILAMLPMSATVLFVYGIIGYVGKDYEMPLAVLSTLVLGIGVDFAIHFLSRYRELHRETGSVSEAMRLMFEEPARALSRNALVIGIGFIPLLFSSLVPYIVVGVLLASIMILSWLGTLLGLPSIIVIAHRNKDARPGEVAAK